MPSPLRSSIIKNTALLLSGVFLSAAVAAESCVDGLWRFDKKNSDNLNKISKKLQNKSAKNKQSETPAIPPFVLSDADLIVSKTADAVFISLQDNKARSRRFSTAGKTQAVSLKQLNKGKYTVVASWEEHALIVETTTPQGVYIEEVFTVEAQEDATQRLRIDSRLRNRVGLQLAFSKSYIQAEDDWQLCMAHASTNNKLSDSTSVQK